MYAVFYRASRAPEIVYDIDAQKLLLGEVNRIKLISDRECIIGDTPYRLEVTPRWRTLRATPIRATDDRPAYNIFCADHVSIGLQAMREAPWLNAKAEADIAIKNEIDFFLLLQKSMFIDSFSGKSFYNDSPIFDIDAYEWRAKYFSPPFGVFAAFGATTFAPNLVQTRSGDFVSDPLGMALWTTAKVGGAIFSESLGKVYYNSPDTDNYRRLSGVGLLLASVNYGHWHTQNIPALFALKRLLDLRIFAVEDVTIVAPQPEMANIDIVDHYLRLLRIEPRVFDPVKEGVGAFAFDCTLLPSSCSVGRFQWSPFVSTAMSVLREDGGVQDRVLLISRADVGNARGLVNEGEILQALTRSGVAVERVVAGELTYRQQRELFAQAKLVIGTHGSGLTNAVYGGPKCAVLELICDELDGNRGWYHNLFHLLGHRYAAINCPNIQSGAWASPFRADPELVARAVRQLLSEGNRL